MLGPLTIYIYMLAERKKIRWHLPLHFTFTLFCKNIFLNEKLSLNIVFTLLNSKKYRNYLSNIIMSIWLIVFTSCLRMRAAGGERNVPSSSSQMSLLAMGSTSDLSRKTMNDLAHMHTVQYTARVYSWMNFVRLSIAID